jgi:hypothetical protein
MLRTVANLLESPTSRYPRRSRRSGSRILGSQPAESGDRLAVCECGLGQRHRSPAPEADIAVLLTVDDGLLKRLAMPGDAADLALLTPWGASSGQL